jgi:magnesium-transporting ATPase (P-type)
MRIQDLNEVDVPAALQSTRDGLSEGEAQKRLFEYGKNILRTPPTEKPTAKLTGELTHLSAVILWIAALLCFLVSATSAEKEMNAIGLAIIAVIFINAFFSYWQSIRAERALHELEKLLPRTTLVLRNKVWMSIPADDIVPGDVVQLTEGEIAGADIRIIASNRMRVDTSYLTGESIPAFRRSSADPSGQPLHARNLIFAGMRVVAGSATGVAFATGGKTEFAKIAELTVTKKPQLSPLQEEIKITSKRIAIIAVILGIVLFISGLSAGLELSRALIFGIGLIVANIPEGLMPTMTLSLAIAAQRMAKKKFSSNILRLSSRLARQLLFAPTRPEH